MYFREINDNLTKQIKTISNNLFLYFDTFNGNMPDNWKYVQLTDIAKLSTGYSYKSKELMASNMAMATIKSFNRNGGFTSRGFKEIKPNKIIKNEKYANLFDIIVAHTDLTQNADIIGNAEPILDTDGYKKIIYSMDLVKITPKNNLISPYLLALILQGNRLKAHCLGYVNGTTVLHLSKKALKEFKIPLPDNYSELYGVSKFAEYAYKKMSCNLVENRKLGKLKQELLNKFF